MSKHNKILQEAMEFYGPWEDWDSWMGPTGRTYFLAGQRPDGRDATIEVPMGLGLNYATFFWQCADRINVLLPQIVEGRVRE
jgi:hypothetical protein